MVVEDTVSVNVAKVGALRDGLDAVRGDQQQQQQHSATTSRYTSSSSQQRSQGSPRRSFSPAGSRGGGGEDKYRALTGSAGTAERNANNIGGEAPGHRGAATAAAYSQQQQRFGGAAAKSVQGNKTDLPGRQAGAAVGVVTGGSATASGVGNSANHHQHHLHNPHQLRNSSSGSSQNNSGSSSPAPLAATGGGSAAGGAARWVPPSLLPKHLLSSKAKDDAIHRQVRSILNKLTPDKFQPLSDELLKIYYEAPHILNGVVVLIFEKALDEPKYSSMYAQLCKRLSDSVSQFDGNAGNSSNQAGGPQTFLDVLSKVCWEKFENRFKYYQVGGEGPVNGEEAVLTADEEERQHVVKQKMLGNLKFIGELYLLGQLDDPIIHNCILQLLGNDKVSADLQVGQRVEKIIW